MEQPSSSGASFSARGRRFLSLPRDVLSAADVVEAAGAADVVTEADIEAAVGADAARVDDLV